MAAPFLSEIKMVGFNFAPRGWAECDGTLLQISTNQSLYSLLGATFGGDSRTTFALPDMRGRVPMHMGEGYDLGLKSGTERVTIDASTSPAHTHPLYASNQEADIWSTYQPSQPLRTLGVSSVNIYADAGNQTELHPQSVTASGGGGQAHDNMQPYLAIKFIMAVQGLFPSRN